jgi:NitT/TauT family transport system permease protein
MKRLKLTLLQIAVGIGFLVLWHVLTAYPILAPTRQTQFFFSTPIEVLARVWKEFASGEIWRHLGITLLETILAFAFGAGGGILFGFLFARRALLAAVFDPYIKAANALPRVVLAPIFALWFGLGIWSKVALGFTLVFFIVFFNVYQGVREVNPVVLANARMLGMNERQWWASTWGPRRGSATRSTRRRACSTSPASLPAW